MIKIDCETFNSNYNEKQAMKKYSGRLLDIEKVMMKKESMLDWSSISSTISKPEIAEIKKIAKEINQNNSKLVVVGIGGSYLGAKAVIQALSNAFTQNVLFAGTNLDPENIAELLDCLKNQDYYVNVISKSGNTLEPKIAFNLLKNALKKKYGENYKQRVIVTTSAKSGSLLSEANKAGYRKLVVPENIGGRFSVLSPVGLLPIAVAGININELLEGAQSFESNINEAQKLAVLRDDMFNKGFGVEAITIYNSKLEGIGMWLQQLFAESQGKNKKGVLPFVNQNTTNLHSIGQFLQEGPNILFETVIKVKNQRNVKIDGFSISLGELNNLVAKNVALAHQQGETPSVVIEIENISARSIGELLMFFMFANSIGAYLLDVNPFDQPGVEAYKKLVNNELKNFEI